MVAFIPRVRTGCVALRSIEVVHDLLEIAVALEGSLSTRDDDELAGDAIAGAVAVRADRR